MMWGTSLEKHQWSAASDTTERDMKFLSAAQLKCTPPLINSDFWENFNITSSIASISCDPETSDSYQVLLDSKTQPFVLEYNYFTRIILYEKLTVLFQNRLFLGLYWVIYFLKILDRWKKETIILLAVWYVGECQWTRRCRLPVT